MMCWVNCAFLRAHFCIFLFTNAVFPIEQGKKNFLFEVGVFKQGDMLKQMFQKAYKISFRMYLNLLNAKFSRIDVEKRVYKEVNLSLHFSVASFNMKLGAQFNNRTFCIFPYGWIDCRDTLCAVLCTA